MVHLDGAQCWKRMSNEYSTKLQKRGVLDADIGERSEVLCRKLKDEVNPQWCSLIFRRIMKFNKNNHCRSYGI